MIGDKIKTLRKKRGLTRRKLSDAVGLTEATIYMIEAGRESNPKLLTLDRIAAALGTTTAKLLR